MIFKLAIFVCIAVLLSSSAAADERTCDDCSGPEHGPIFVPPGAPTLGPCDPAFARLQKTMNEIKERTKEWSRKTDGIVDSYTTYGPMQITIQDSKWTSGLDGLKVRNDSHFFCTPDMYLDKYATQVTIELPPGQIIEGGIGTWAWGADTQNRFILNSTKAITLSLRWQYDSAGGWPVTQSVRMGGDLGAFQMTLTGGCNVYCGSVIQLIEDELNMPRLENKDRVMGIWQKLETAMYELIKDYDHK